MDVRAEVAKRLKQEMARKGATQDALSRATGLSGAVVNGYLTAKREISFTELSPLCDALSLRLMRLLAPNFGNPCLQYRNTAGRNKAKISEIENAFLLLSDLLPKPKRFAAPDLNDGDGDVGMLLSEVKAAAEELRGRHPTVEALYRAVGLPILPVAAGDEAFDACIMRVRDRSVVCVNADRPTARIHFSLLHEMAHYLWHRDREIPIDERMPERFQEAVTREERPEYVANKFAQLFLVPWDDAERFALQWQRLPDTSEFLRQRRTTPHVLAWAIYDCLRFQSPSRRPSYIEVRDAVVQSAQENYAAGSELRIFLDESGRSLAEEAWKHRDAFADDVWADLARAWGLVRG